jgi:ankyrin repeat protein
MAFPMANYERINRELINAVRFNNLPEVSRLLSVGADVNAKDHLGRASLHWACIEGYMPVFKELLDHGADVHAKDIMHGNTPLHWASRCDNHVAAVNELLSRGVGIEAKNKHGNTPLHLASLNDHLPVVQALVSCGADVLAANNNGELPLHKAVAQGHSEVSKYLLQKFYATIRRLPLHELLKDLTWIGYFDSSDIPPLRAAIYRYVLGTDDVVEILEFLVDRDPTWLRSRDQDGSLPVHVACRCGAAFTIVQSLLNLYKASVKSVTPQGDLPLFLACEMPETSLDTIFILMKLYPDLVYR